MKKVGMFVFLLAGSSVQATIFETDPTKLLKKGEDPEKSGIVFELKNKSKRPIWISVANGGVVLANKAFRVDAGETIGSTVPYNLGLKTEMAVWYSDPGMPIKFEPTGLGLLGKNVFTPKPNKLYALPLHKTHYITWDEANYARPQTGPLGGVLGKTDSGLSLKNNVQKGELQEQP